jgi:hypothetical protein
VTGGGGGGWMTLVGGRSFVRSFVLIRKERSGNGTGRQANHRVPTIPMPTRRMKVNASSRKDDCVATR